MSVSLYCSARREQPLTESEAASVDRIVAAHTAAFPYGDEESLYLYAPDEADADQILAGSTKLPRDPGRLLPVIVCVLDSVTGLRRAVEGAEWRVHSDDLDVPWDEAEGYALPGMRDPGLVADLCGP
ncbi:hypothetical protein F0344_01455 [Streptomyces finlayi]|uniref:Uncharacterized protein n=1 Tax=Streptomyces finlayi TaxID=67296 RepID=A0A7G7BDP1_9ACTN|nr:hypothetical protein [Streptomyces finlayi]QNE73456.1 hypothetical protein F0344_01455 [Streptomyces finlayi]